jgi:hypothetical protein
VLDKAAQESALRENEQEKTRLRAATEAEFNRRVLAHDAAANAAIPSHQTCKSHLANPVIRSNDKVP